jgi:hypothetical protein
VVAAFAALLLQQSTLTFPTGYYTLREVAAKATAAGFPTTTAAECADDIYALRISGQAWPQFQKVLSADERLQFQPTAEGWRIERAVKSKTSEASCLRKYLAEGAAQIYDLYGTTAQRIRQIDALPTEERDRQSISSETARTDSPTEAARKYITYLWYSNEIPFISIAAVALATAPNTEPSFGKCEETDLLRASVWYNTRGTLDGIKFPGGFNAERMGEGPFREFLRKQAVLYKIVLDPLTFSAESRITVWGEQFLAPMQPETISPGRSSFHIKIPQEKVWTAAALTDIRKRAAETIGSLSANTPVQLPSRPLRISEALLLAADESKSELVFNVSPFTDLVYQYDQPVSLAGIVPRADTKKAVQSWLSLNVAQRSSEENSQEVAPALDMPHTLSATSVDGTVVVRDEIRFLGGLCPSPPGFTSLDNAKLRDGEISLKSLADHLKGIDPSNWKTSFFSSNYLHTCNPVAFRPFAMAWQNSTKLQRIVKEARSGNPAELKFSDLESAGQSAFTRAMEAAAPHNDSLQYVASGGLIRFAASHPENSETSMIVERDGNRITWTFRNPRAKIWTAWTIGVEPSLND